MSTREFHIHDITITYDALGLIVQVPRAQIPFSDIRPQGSSQSHPIATAIWWLGGQDWNMFKFVHFETPTPSSWNDI